MNAEVARPGGLERIWRHSILPLLEEHYLGTGVDVPERFGLTTLRRALRSTPPMVPADPDGVGDAPSPQQQDATDDGDGPNQSAP
jgi:hypothetical protein